MNLKPYIYALNIINAGLFLGFMLVLFYSPFIQLYEPNPFIRLGEIVMFGLTMFCNAIYLWREYLK